MDDNIIKVYNKPKITQVIHFLLRIRMRMCLLTTMLSSLVPIVRNSCKLEQGIFLKIIGILHVTTITCDLEIR